MSFVHLHVHSEYSDLDGMIRVADLFRVAAEKGQDAAAITDHGNLGAIWSAQAHAKKAGVKLIAGCEFYLANGSRHDKLPFRVPTGDTSADEDTERGDANDKIENSAQGGRKNRPYQHLTVLARTPAGWRNLVALNNKAQESKWQKARIDFELLKEHAEGLVVLTGCLGGPVMGPMSHAWIAGNEAVEAERELSAAESALPSEVAQSLVDTGEDDGLPELSEAHQAARSNVLALRRRVSALKAEADGYRESAQQNIDALIAAVGRENVYVEIMEHGIEEESAVLPQVVELARANGIAIVATNDAHHTHEHDASAQAAWLLVQSKSTLVEPKFQFHGHGYWLRSEDEMRALRPEAWWQEACDNTQLVADRVEENVIPGHRDLLPKFPTPEGFADNRDYIYHLLRDGARQIFGGISKQVRDRVQTEMRVIEDSKYIDYFLVVHDLIAWAGSDRCVHDKLPASPDANPSWPCRAHAGCSGTKSPILVGPGRGSAGGSLVAYLLEITRVDPLRYNLLFERFLEAGRNEPPDIDIDFPQTRRDEVIAYLGNRWGSGNVAFIGTYQIARSRAAIKDAARVLRQGAVGNKMSELVPIVEAQPMGMADLMDPQRVAATEYRKYIERTERIDALGNKDDNGEPAGNVVHALASSFENVVKGVGLHASGIIVSAEPLKDIVPMRKTDRGWALQWTGPEAEQVGLLKVDVLGLRNLDIVAKAIEYIEQSTGETIDAHALPDPDNPDEANRARVDNAWRVISEGRTEGLFQLESPKMTELAQEVAPRSLNDLSALVALFRPGPMGKGLHTEYAARKRDPGLVSYRDYTTNPAEQQALESVLGETFGLLVYQEQVMMLGTVVAGFSASERSMLRKAVSKKNKDLMEKVGAMFMDGAPKEHLAADGTVVSIPFSKTTAETLWDSMVSFAEYAFNRSHSATYGYLAYVTAFLKGNWPVEFAAATLAVTSGTEKRQQVLRSLRREGIEALAPDVNSGNADTSPAGENAIRIGLSEVKGLDSVGARIAEVRVSSGKPFESIHDLYTRVSKVSETADGQREILGSAITSAHVKSLIEAGALDQWCDGNRLGLLLVAAAAKSVDIDPPKIDWGVLERATRQRDALGLTIGEHPLTSLQDQISEFRIFGGHGGWNEKSSISLVPIGRIPDTDGASVTTVGIVSAWSEKAYSRGRMANIVLEGSSASISGTMWDQQLSAHIEDGTIPHVGDVVAITGRVRFRTITTDAEDAGAEDNVIKELSISQVRKVPIRDDSVGSWPQSDVVVPNLVRGAFEYEKLDLDTTVSPEPEPVVELAPVQEPVAETVPVVTVNTDELTIAPVISLEEKRNSRNPVTIDDGGGWEITTQPQGVPTGDLRPYVWTLRGATSLVVLLIQKVGLSEEEAKLVSTKSQMFLGGAAKGTLLVTHKASGAEFFVSMGVTGPQYANAEMSTPTL